jgi:hypothetical protein
MNKCPKLKNDNVKSKVDTERNGEDGKSKGKTYRAPLPHCRGKKKV